MTTTAVERLKDARKSIARLHPECLQRHELYLIRSTLIGVLDICEQLYSLNFEETNMATATTTSDAKADAEDYTRFDILFSAGDVDGALEVAKQEAETAYRELVISYFDGRRVDPGKLRSVLSDASRTADDFKRHLSLVSERREAIANLALADELAATLPSLEAKRDAAGTVLKKREEAYSKEIAPLLATSLAAAEEYANTDVKAKDMRREAINTLCRSAGPEFLEGLKPLSNRAASFEKKIYDAENEARRAKAEIPKVEANILILEGQILREETGGYPDKQIAPLRTQLDLERAKLARLADSDKVVADLRDEAKAAKGALEQYQRDGTYNSRFIKW